MWKGELFALNSYIVLCRILEISILTKLNCYAWIGKFFGVNHEYYLFTHWLQRNKYEEDSEVFERWKIKMV